MQKRAFLAGLVFVVAGSMGFSAQAGPYPLSDLPPQLEPWVQWVLDEVPEYSCPAVDGEAVCIWPGELQLTLGANGGRFTQKITADGRDMVFSLPGDADHWPQDVRLNGRPVSVFPLDGRPVVVLERGSWTITGSMLWNEMPEGIQIPVETALIALDVDSTPVPFPRRDENGLLWLQSAVGDGEEGDRLDLEVYRKIGDAIPMKITTRLVVRVSGKSREMDLGSVLVPGTTVLSVDADIPARVDKDGHLRIQVRAGTHNVSIEARTNGPLKEIPSAKRAEPWPQEEIWVWQASELLRQVSLDGAPGIDPSRTNLPKDWNGMPAFLLGPEGKLVLTETRRGEPAPPPDQLSLSREFWMDLDGDGYTVRDNLSGELNQTWRIDLETDGDLGHVQVNGEDQLITENPGSKKPGVELRNGSLDMNAEWRMENGVKQLPAVGWTEDVQSLSATLYLPPGYTLLGAKGVDELPYTWWDEWDLFGFFFVLLVSIAMAKLTRWYFGIVTLISLVLLHQQAELGFVVFISLSLLVFLGLLKVLPKGKLHFATRICWWMTVLILVVALIPFIVNHFRTGVHPQIDESGDYNDFDFLPVATLAAPMAMGGEMDETLSMEMEKAIVAADAEPSPFGGVNVEDEVGQYEKNDDFKAKPKKKREIPAQQQMQQDGRGDLIQSISKVSSSNRLSGYDIVSGKKGGKSSNLWRQSLQQDPKAIVQTGPGVPTWSWRSWSLSWSGPVNKEHEIKLYTIGPKVHLALSLLRIALLVILSIVIIREALKTIRIKKGDLPPANKKTGKPVAKAAKAAAAATALALMMAVPFAANGAEEPIPDRSTLDELRQRLTRDPTCGDDCVSTSNLTVAIAESTLSLRAEVHAAAATSWKIPGPAGNWVPASVTVDGRQTYAIALLDDGFLHVRLEAGVHTVQATGPAPPNDAVTLEFGQLPHRVVAEAPGWSVEGIREDGRAETSIQLSRIQKLEGTDAAEAGADFDENAYPPFLKVTRTMDLGIPWLVHTRVTRVSPTGSPVMAKIPLLEGEAVTESELQVEENSVILTMGRDDTEVRWSSTLEEQKKLELVADEGKPWTEVWVIKCSPVWSCEHTGIPPIKHKVSDRLQPTFRPWPGEKLLLETKRPGGVEGQSVTIDSAMLTVSPGIRLLTADLELSVRSSQGGVQTITLPEKAAIQTLTVNGAERPVRQEGRKVEITLRPGSQNIRVNWQQPGGIKVTTVVPEVDLGGPAANVRTVVNLPDDRWLIATDGPSWGPAILFWGFLAAILIGGFILGFIKLSPLKWWQWILLGLGFTQIPPPVALLIVGWFFILSWRKQKPLAHFFWHNSLQIVIGLWTLVALICMFVAVYSGLAVQPDMQVAGTGSSNTHLVWYLDRIDGAMPTPEVTSLPIMIWRGVMLAWSLWLAASLVMWARWGWKAFSHELLWRSIPRKSIAPQAPAPQAPAPQPEPPVEAKPEPEPNESK